MPPGDTWRYWKAGWTCSWARRLSISRTRLRYTQDAQHQTEGVDEQVPLAPGELLGAVVAMASMASSRSLRSAAGYGAEGADAAMVHLLVRGRDIRLRPSPMQALTMSTVSGRLIDTPAQSRSLRIQLLDAQPLAISLGHGVPHADDRSLGRSLKRKA